MNTIALLMLASASLTPKIAFTIKDPKTEARLAYGTETTTENNGMITKITENFDDKDKMIQSESVSFLNDTMKLEVYDYLNMLTGEEIHVKSGKDQQIQIQYAADRKNKPKDGTATWEKDAIVGKSMSFLVDRNWSKLQKGDELLFKLFVPSKQEAYPFRLRFLKKDTVGDKKVLSFKLEPQSWLIRNMVPDMVFHYEDVATTRLIRYEGPTTAVTDGNADRKVIIDFSYP